MSQDFARVICEATSLVQTYTTRIESIENWLQQPEEVLQECVRPEKLQVAKDELRGVKADLARLYSQIEIMKEIDILNKRAEAIVKEAEALRKKLVGTVWDSAAENENTKAVPKTS